MMKFEYQWNVENSYTAGRKVELELPETPLELDQVLEGFEDFLRGCGYQFKGHVVIEEEEPCGMSVK